MGPCLHQHAHSGNHDSLLHHFVNRHKVQRITQYSQISINKLIHQITNVNLTEIIYYFINSVIIYRSTSDIEHRIHIFSHISLTFYITCKVFQIKLYDVLAIYLDTLLDSYQVKDSFQKNMCKYLCIFSCGEVQLNNWHMVSVTQKLVSAITKTSKTTGFRSCGNTSNICRSHTI